MLNLLIVGPSWVGDAVMMQSLLRRLKTHAEPSRISVLTPAYLEGLLRFMPEVDETIVNPFAHGKLKLGERWRLGRSLHGRFDAALVLPNSLKSGLIPWFAGIPRRIGFIGEGRWLLLNDSRRLDARRLPRMVDRFDALAEALGVPASAPFLPPRLIAPAADVAAVRERLGIGGGPAVAFCFGAAYGPAKQWPAEHFAALAKRLQGMGVAAWLVGSDQEAARAREIEALAPGAVVNVSGRTKLTEAAALLSSASAIVANDTGLMHVSAALGRPMVALYGSSSPTFTPPLSDHAKVLKLDIDCSPCFKRECPLGHFNCMRKLEPDLVFDTLRSMVELAPS